MAQVLGPIHAQPAAGPSGWMDAHLGAVKQEVAAVPVPMKREVVEVDSPRKAKEVKYSWNAVVIMIKCAQLLMCLELLNGQSMTDLSAQGVHRREILARRRRFSTGHQIVSNWLQTRRVRPR